MLNWIDRFNIFAFLDNPSAPVAQSEFRLLVAAGAKRLCTAQAGEAFAALRAFRDADPSWLFGHLGYDLKNELFPGLTSSHPASMQFPDLLFFEPEWVFEVYANRVVVHGCGNAAEVWQQIQACSTELKAGFQPGQIASKIKPLLSRKEYLTQIHAVQAHIQRGDCYELNFCQEFVAEQVQMNPLAVYDQLATLSPNPFSVLYRWNDHYALGASPERFIKKQGQRVWSQPIKGTARRSLQEPEADSASRNALLASEKERAENVMVVDLVRNDLSRSCQAGTVAVEELFGIYSFPQVHQMISTVRGDLRADQSLFDVLETCFPMGSMTGAPKKRVLELIEAYERFRRGLFSGAIGYITPTDDADFNVVIRSLFYRSDIGRLSFATGSGITRYADPEMEYDECLLKAEAIKAVL